MMQATNGQRNMALTIQIMMTAIPNPLMKVLGNMLKNRAKKRMNKKNLRPG